MSSVRESAGIDLMPVMDMDGEVILHVLGICLL